MTLSTHYTFSIFILSLIKKEPSIFLFSLFSLLPDIDTKIKDHRGITHSFCLVSYLLPYLKVN